MLTKLKIALITSAALVAGAAGIAAAQGGGGGFAKRAERKAEMLEKYDLNKDGKLDLDEKKAMHEEHLASEFAKLDANGDGQLSLDEFKAQKMHHARMGKFRGGRGGFRKGGRDR